MATNPHIYVSSVHGTNTGASDTSFASAQTGAMTSLTAGNVYDSLISAISGASPSNGDTIYVADNHTFTGTPSADILFNSAGGMTGAGVLVVSVSATNIDQYSPGADEDIGGIRDYQCSGIVKIAGVSLEGDDDTLVIFGNSSAYLQDMTVTGSNGAGDTPITMTNSGDGASVYLVNTDIVFGGTSSNIPTGNGSLFDMFGGSITGSIPANAVFDGIGGGGGATIRLTGVDLSAMSGTLFAFGTLTDTDNILILMQDCRLHASTTLHGSLSHKNVRFEMYNCDDSTGNDIYRFEVADGTGSAKNNESTYVTATETWYEGTDKSSIEVITTTQCSKLNPFRFTLPAQYIDLSSASSDVITLEITTDQTLTDTQIAAFLVYPDGTTALQSNFVTSGKTVGAGNYGIDPLAAGTALTTSSLGAADWTGEPTSPNFYKMELDTSGDAGQAAVCEIMIEVYEPSILAGELFIHPLLTVS